MSAERYCQHCRSYMIPWNGAWMCLQCDNRGGTEHADWAMKWIRQEEGR